MTKSFNRKALGAFWKLGAVALITATLAVFFTACKQTSGGGGKQGAPFVEGGASLILNPNCLTIKVKAKTEDSSDIAVEGCKETTLKSDIQNETELHAKGTKVILKGKISELNCSWNYLVAVNVQGLTALQELDCFSNGLTELNVQGLTALRELECSANKLTSLNVQDLPSLQKLNCWENKLTSLNVQGLTALNSLWCWSNQLNAQAMTELLKGLPAREEGDKAEAVLYTEETGVTEGNCKDYNTPAELKAALEGAKKRNWTLMKVNASEKWEDL